MDNFFIIPVGIHSYCRTLFLLRIFAAHDLHADTVAENPLITSASSVPNHDARPISTHHQKNEQKNTREKKTSTRSRNSAQHSLPFQRNIHAKCGHSRQQQRRITPTTHIQGFVHASVWIVAEQFVYQEKYPPYVRH